tara:strand:- start:238 stop:663 length:426 start_codon:yes stop_codon:yes gene_type:complete
MKITKNKLKQIIKEELENILSEDDGLRDRAGDAFADLEDMSDLDDLEDSPLKRRTPPKREPVKRTPPPAKAPADRSREDKIQRMRDQAKKVTPERALELLRQQVEKRQRKFDKNPNDATKTALNSAKSRLKKHLEKHPNLK